ncbi:MAG: hypothetical protein ACD_7C00047G0012 [uncultured bacterium]|nr:MAG: hypothetical protein ACD_7C00047G0012 [uncultured bacterium]HBR78886.1 hypothetical protein [Candidatus Moranbacteria bacterium]
MKKIISGLSLLILIPALSGCAGTTKEEKEETINPFSPSSMVNTYDTSKDKINDTTQKQNESTTKALEESGINE